MERLEREQLGRRMRAVTSQSITTEFSPSPLSCGDLVARALEGLRA